MRAVQFDDYGDVDVLDVRDVPEPVPGREQVLVQVRTAGLNPGEIAIRSGALHERWPATFPSGQGSDFAGAVVGVGSGVDAFAAGDEVLGWTDERSAQAELVAVPAQQLVPRPATVPWEVAGALVVAGGTAWAAVHAVALGEGDTVAVSAAAGGVGAIAVQLAVRTGARVIGLAGEHNHPWLRGHGVEPLSHGDGLAERLRAAAPRLDAFLDLFGGGYVDLAVELGVAPDRIDTIIDYDAAARHGARQDASTVGMNRDVVQQLTDLIAAGELEVPIAAIYPLGSVRDAYRDLADRRTRGKRVLVL